MYDDVAPAPKTVQNAMLRIITGKKISRVPLADVGPVERVSNDSFRPATNTRRTAVKACTFRPSVY